MCCSCCCLSSSSFKLRFATSKPAAKGFGKSIERHFSIDGQFVFVAVAEKTLPYACK